MAVKIHHEAWFNGKHAFQEEWDGTLREWLGNPSEDTFRRVTDLYDRMPSAERKRQVQEGLLETAFAQARKELPGFKMEWAVAIPNIPVGSIEKLTNPDWDLPNFHVSFFPIWGTSYDAYPAEHFWVLHYRAVPNPGISFPRRAYSIQELIEEAKRWLRYLQYVESRR